MLVQIMIEDETNYERGEVDALCTKLGINGYFGPYISTTNSNFMTLQASLSIMKIGLTIFAKPFKIEFVKDGRLTHIFPFMWNKSRSAREFFCRNCLNNMPFVQVDDGTGMFLPGMDGKLCLYYLDIFDDLQIEWFCNGSAAVVKPEPCTFKVHQRDVQRIEPVLIKLGYTHEAKFSLSNVDHEYACTFSPTNPYHLHLLRQKISEQLSIIFE